jgi:hypothetical protein
VKKFLVFLCAGMLLVATCLVVSTPAFAVPVVDGFLDGNEYSNSFEAGWYNGHKQEYSQFKKADDHTTTVYWESTDDFFYLYIEAPLEAKNMIWGDGFTEEEALLYYQQFKTHHGETFDQFKSNKTDFATMTGSEKVIFGQGVKADLAGDATGTFYGNILDYKDSVDYVIDILGYDDTNSAAADIPMAFEFKFDYLIQSEIDTLISDIQGNELEFHLSPERGGAVAPAPEPTTMLLLGSGLIGLIGFRRKFRKS